MLNQSQPILKEGWCTKLGEVFKTWKKRWFVLEGSTLRYYSDNSINRVLKGEIELKPEYEIKRCPQCKKQPAFSINTLRRLYQIVACNPVDCDDWITILNTAKLGRSSDKVSLDDFNIIKTIGKGAYGKVTLAQNKFDGKFYALKSLCKQNLQENDLIDKTIRERDTLMKVHHPFLVRAHYAFQSDTHIFLAQEFLPGGDLFSRLEQVKTVSENQTKNYIAMLILAVGELHSNGIIHRDLKPDNILFDEKGYLKITDFGLVQFEIKKGKTTDTFCGTPEYIAPEILEDKPYGRSVDWWALGIITYKMLYYAFPFYNANTSEMYLSIINDPFQFPENSEISENAKDFITKLLIKSPEQRLGSSDDDYKELQRHPWFEGFQWDQLLEKNIPMEYMPKINESNITSNFEKEFTDMPAAVTPQDANQVSATTQLKFQGFTMVIVGKL